MATIVSVVESTALRTIPNAPFPISSPIAVALVNSGLTSNYISWFEFLTFPVAVRGIAY